MHSLVLMMRGILLATALAIFAGCGTTSGYAVVSGGTAAGTSDVVPAGSELIVALDQHLSAGRLVPGARVVGHTLGDLRGYGGEVLVPRGSRVHGRVIDRRGYGMDAAVWVRMELIDMGGLRQRMSSEPIGIRGVAAPGTRFRLRLDRPIRSYASLSGRYY
jgi:hypothetical protein